MDQLHCVIVFVELLTSVILKLFLKKMNKNGKKKRETTWLLV